MKKALLSAFILLCSFSVFAQSGLLVQNNGKGLYVPHTVQAKENFYSIGRLYAISPKDIAAFNNLDMAKGLNIGQTISIPLNASNFSQSASKGVPVYYVVGDKEGLYRVSVNNNNVLMANLRKWNNLNSDMISAGQKLIVGYLQTAETPPATVAVTSTPVQTEAPVAKQPVQEQPQQEKPRVAEQTADVARNKPAATTQSNNHTSNTSAPINQPAGAGGAGYFKGQFDVQSRAIAYHKNAAVTAGIFKTSSGWQDGKYYALMDGVEPGTIIRVVNPSNSKAVYAKVLGEMSGIRQNQGLDVRISNAAASALEVTEQDKFVVQVNY